MNRVLVAMSGGVDSAVAALLLRERGYEVTGATMKLFHNEEIGITGESGCCSLDDTRDARRVCHRLGVEHHVFGFAGVFRREVIGRFAEDYVQGRTPNPCLDCNRFVKFPLLLRRAELMGLDGIATGHYARVERDDESGRWRLLRGVDEGKDQSYVLYAMSQEELSRTQFPLGEMTKGKVRQKAVEAGFAVADKPDSQDICFVPDGDYAGFLQEALGVEGRPGPVLDPDGRIIGEHGGIHRFTVGQRRGLPVSLGGRTYVTGIDPKNAAVMVGREKDLYAEGMVVGDLNWIAVEGLDAPTEVTVQTRYRGREVPAVVRPVGDATAAVEFLRPQRAVTPGQAAVFYRGDVVVGGGTIQSAEHRS